MTYYDGERSTVATRLYATFSSSRFIEPMFTRSSVDLSSCYTKRTIHRSTESTPSARPIQTGKRIWTQRNSSCREATREASLP
jgi:hypothetical protein